MHKGDGRMHFSEALMHDEIAPLRGCERDPMAQFNGIIINVWKIERFTRIKNYMFISLNLWLGKGSGSCQ